MTAQTSARRGRFITLEGGEGAGKTTQIQRLADTLRAAGIEVMTTREPGGTPGADALRSLVVTGDGDRWDSVSEALLMYTARRDHVLRRIRPALAAGTWVICDRFSDSTMAYQGYARGLGRDWVERLDALVLDGFKPDLSLFFDMPVAEGLKRAGTRGGPDRFEKLGIDFHETLRKAFLDIAAREPDRIAVIDALGTPETVTARLMDVVMQRFPEIAS